jgi:enoyl-CoA hydratase/carnithine racemase
MFRRRGCRFAEKDMRQYFHKSRFPAGYIRPPPREPAMPDIDVRVDHAIATVTLDRSTQRNAMTLAMWRELARLFGELGRDGAVRVIMLTGAGGHFSVGADITEFDALRADAAQSAAYEQAVDACSDAIAAAPKPTIAVVDGYCLGGGCHLAMACDFRFAGDLTVFGIPAARLSIVYGLRSTRRLLALVGLANAKRVLFAGERFGAAEALRIGLADVVADHAIRAADEFAATLVDNAPLSIAGAKLMLDGLAMGTLDPAAAQAAIDRAAQSEDYAEGRRAFAEKRRPAFRGR